MRYTYENKQTLANERKVIDVFCEKRGLVANKLPKFYQIDFALFLSERLQSWAEVKCRNCERYQYSTFIISAHKISAGLHWERISRRPFYLIVSYTDGIFYIQPSGVQYTFRWGGRDDRDDEQDMEVVSHFQINDFMEINE